MVEDQRRQSMRCQVFVSVLPRGSWETLKIILQKQLKTFEAKKDDILPVSQVNHMTSAKQRASLFLNTNKRGQ